MGKDDLSVKKNTSSDFLNKYFLPFLSTKSFLRGEIVSQATFFIVLEVSSQWEQMMTHNFA